MIISIIFVIVGSFVLFLIYSKKSNKCSKSTISLNARNQKELINKL